MAMANEASTETILDGEKQSTHTIPAYFLSLTVENIRCFGPHQTLDLSDGNGRPAQWTIILGDNGVGKTTLLQTLAALIPIEDPIQKQLNNERAVAARYSRIALSSFNWRFLREDLSNTSYISAVFFSGGKLTEYDKGEEVGNLRVTFFHGLGAEQSIMPYEKLNEIACFGYGATRHMSERHYLDKDEDNPNASLFSDDVALLNPEEWLLQADYAASKESSIQDRAIRQRDEIIDVLKILLPEVKEIKIIPPNKNLPRPKVAFRTPYAWVPIEELSLGYKTLIAWMVDFASRMFERYPDSPNPLAEPAVVLVDEIDLHLHPKWQRTLMGYLSERFPNTQFIATAHSPLVVQAAQDANIVLLRREGDHVVIENNVEAVRNWRVDQILTSDLFGLESARPPETDKLLAERTKILSKSRLTKKDRERLKELEEEIGSLPTGETSEEIEAMDVIRRAAERLKAKGY
jgi:energy-coupling factor transporter ATP-binding protein EcfA2